MAGHPAGPGHTRCGWADASRFVDGPTWPRDEHGQLRTLRASDFRIGHEGPLAPLRDYRTGRELAKHCRVCGYVCAVDYRGEPVAQCLGDPLCSSRCVSQFMGYLLDTRGLTTEELVRGS